MARIYFIATNALLWFCSSLALAMPVSPESHIAVAPDMSINAKGHIALMWVDRSPDLTPAQTDHHQHTEFARTNLYVAISRDGGESFTPPVKVNHDPAVVRGQNINRPRIAGAANGDWHISYAANELHPDTGKPLMTSHYTRSTDGGRSFEPPRRLSELNDIDRGEFTHGDFMTTAGFQSIAVTPSSVVRTFWIDTRYRTAEDDASALYSAVSRDGGNTFDAAEELMKTGVCPCCQLMTEASAGSSLYLSLRSVSASGLRQPTVIQIEGDTAAMSVPVDAGHAAWEIEGCPLKPTALALQGNRVFTAVYSGGEERPGVYVSLSSDSGANFGPSTAVHPNALVSDAPSIAANENYALLVWHGKTDSRRQIFSRMYGPSGQAIGGVRALTNGLENASNPVVAVRADGRFQVTWIEADRIHTTVLPSTPGEIELGQR